jgi:hypothetical protein
MTYSALGRLLGLSLTLTLTAAPGLAQGSFDGTWILKRSFAANANARECGPMGMDFRITIKGSVVSAPGGRGTVSPSGAIRFPGVGNYFTGTVYGNSVTGTYTGRCQGTFSGRRR